MAFTPHGSTSESDETGPDSKSVGIQKYIQCKGGRAGLAILAENDSALLIRGSEPASLRRNLLELCKLNYEIKASDLTETETESERAWTATHGELVSSCLGQNLNQVHSDNATKLLYDTNDISDDALIVFGQMEFKAKLFKQDDLLPCKDDTTVPRYSELKFAPLMEYKGVPADSGIAYEEWGHSMLSKGALLLSEDITEEVTSIMKAKCTDVFDLISVDDIGKSVLVKIGEEGQLFSWAVLTARCQNLKKNSYAQKIKISPKYGKMKDFIGAYQWMLNPNKGLFCSDIISTLKIANHLKISELEREIMTFLDRSDLIGEHRAFALFLKCKIHTYHEFLKDSLLNRGQKCFLIFVASKDFEELTYEEVKQLLEVGNPQVNDEGEILYSIVRWINVDIENRKEHIVSLLNHISWANLSPKYLLEIQGQTGCQELDNVILFPDVKATINRAINFLATIHTTVRRNTPEYVELFDMKMPMERDWIIDPLCKYHHDLKCPFGGKFLKYLDFLEYLQELGEHSKAHFNKIKLARYVAENGGCSNPLCSKPPEGIIFKGDVREPRRNYVQGRNLGRLLPADQGSILVDK